MAVLSCWSWNRNPNISVFSVYLGVFSKVSVVFKLTDKEMFNFHFDNYD